MNFKHIALLTTVCLGFVAVAPTIGALPLGCTAADGNGDNSVLALPRGETFNWTSDCVHVANGGTVFFTSADPASLHGAFRPGCFDLGSMSVTSQTSLKLDVFVEDGFILTEENGSASACGAFEVVGNTVEIVYDCSTHGSAMTGKIIVDL